MQINENVTMKPILLYINLKHKLDKKIKDQSSNQGQGTKDFLRCPVDIRELLEIIIILRVTICS